MREVARLRNLLSGFVTTLKRLFESVMGTYFVSYCTYYYSLLFILILTCAPCFPFHITQGGTQCIKISISFLQFFSFNLNLSEGTSWWYGIDNILYYDH